MFHPVSDNRALSEKIVSQISDHLVRGELAPGDRLPPERELADQFGVSRTVVRDAVKTLAGRGILQVKRGAGIFVVSAEEHMSNSAGMLSEAFAPRGAGLVDLFEIRKVLEAEGAYWAAERRSAHHAGRLRSILEDAWEHRDEPAVLSERDAQFHIAIAEASQNLVFVRVMLTLLDLLESARQRSLSIPGRTQLSLEQHGKILDAIEAHEQEAARRAMTEHLDSVQSAILLPEDGQGTRSAG